MKRKQPPPPDILRKGHTHPDKRGDYDRKRTESTCPRCGGSGYLDSELKQPCPECGEE